MDNSLKWIKIATNIFDNRKIRHIETMPDADTILVVWFKLLALAGTINDNGQVYLTREIPYTAEELSNQFRRPLNTVKLALQIFERLGMIEIIDDFLKLSNWENYQKNDYAEKVREQTRKRVQRFREAHRIEQKNNVTLQCNATVTESNGIEKKRIEEKREEKNRRESELSPAPAHTREEQRNAFGVYKNVLLTGSEVEQLQNELPDRWEGIAQKLSQYKKQTGKTYASDFATIRRWAEEDADTDRKQEAENESFYERAARWAAEQEAGQ